MRTRRRTRRGHAADDRDAQAATAELKTMLQSQPPWARDVDGVRQR